MRRTLVVALVVLAAVLTTAGCGDDETGAAGDGGGGGASLPDRPPDIAGTVTSASATRPPADDCVPPGDDPDAAVSSDDPPACFDPDEAPLGTILVETQPGAEGGDKGSLTVGHDAVLRDAAGGELTFDDLRPGQRVRAWHTGEVAESFPWQARAMAVEIVDDGG